MNLRWTERVCLSRRGKMRTFREGHGHGRRSRFLHPSTRKAAALCIKWLGSIQTGCAHSMAAGRSSSPSATAETPPNVSPRSPPASDLSDAAPSRGMHLFYLFVCFDSVATPSPALTELSNIPSFVRELALSGDGGATIKTPDELNA